MLVGYGNLMQVGRCLELIGWKSLNSVDTPVAVVVGAAAAAV